MMMLLKNLKKNNRSLRKKKSPKRKKSILRSLTPLENSRVSTQPSQILKEFMFKTTLLLPANLLQSQRLTPKTLTIVIRNKKKLILMMVSYNTTPVTIENIHGVYVASSVLPKVDEAESDDSDNQIKS